MDQDPEMSDLGPHREPERPQVPVRSALTRALLLLLAVLSLGVGLVGVVTPGLPTTEFVLLAAWAAARSSPRFHAWLLRNRLFGPMLTNWHNGGRVSRRAKWSACVSMVVCALVLIWAFPYRWAVLAAIAAMAGVQFWLWRRPEP
jgi:uncharacterized protein